MVKKLEQFLALGLVYLVFLQDGEWGWHLNIMNKSVPIEVGDAVEGFL